MAGFVDVAVPLGIRRLFAYAVPEAMQGRIAPGARVLVPFGRKALTGVVAGCSDQPPSGSFKVRSIRELIDSAPLIPPDLVELALWTAERYFAPPGEILRSLFPPGTRLTGEACFRLSERAAGLVAGGLYPSGLSDAEREILHQLAGAGSLEIPALRERTGRADVRRQVESLVERGWLEEETGVMRARVGVKARLFVRARSREAGRGGRLSAAQDRLYSHLVSAMPGASPLQEASRAAGVSPATARELEKKGLVEIFPAPLERLPEELGGCETRAEVALTEDQSSVLETLRGMLREGSPARALLHGVTGSGKTEVYLRLVAEVLQEGGTVLFLVPEISLTPLLSRIAHSHFPDRVALLHSGMSAGERYDQWIRIREGRAQVVVGTRSAVFAPLSGLRLAILDEEHDASYKQDESPCYHAREVAWRRIQAASGLLLMGSATPSAEAYHAARTTGEIRYLCLPRRVESRAMPEVKVVDMALEFQRHGRRTVLSQALRNELQGRLARKEQAILLLNRRGYSRSLLCRSCGHVSSCSECSVAYTYHQESQRLVCHYCASEKEIPAVCEDCGGEFIYFVGVGTEQLEEILKKELREARIARLDRDSTRRRGVLRRTLLDFAARRLDVLVGTQMLAKGHDFPNVTLVGVVSADSGLAFPDFRAAERTFQLLTQVAGRAGRGTKPGVVILQSYYPDHYAIRFARRQDYEGFFSQEIEFRRELGYPPFTRVTQLIVSGRDEVKTAQLAEKVAGALRGAVDSHACGGLRVLGPAQAPLEKLRGSYRFQVLLKSSEAVDPVPALCAAFEALARRKVALKRVQVDVDALSLL